jgi:2'-5' RNA ligase
MDTAPLLVTFALDAESQAFFDTQRELHFPPARNHIPAHISLFHKLPGEELAAIILELGRFCAEQTPLAMQVTKLEMLGRGVAYRLESPESIRVKNHFTNLWRAWLTPQDLARFSPHVTVQNKVAPEEARQLYQELSGSFHPFTVSAPGLVLWRYLQPRWELVQEFAFEQAGHSSSTV